MPSGLDLTLDGFGKTWWLHDMFLGPFGSGKTRQLCRIAEDPDERVFIYDFQAGLAVGMGLPFEYETFQDSDSTHPTAAFLFTRHWNEMYDAAVKGTETFEAVGADGQKATYKTPTVVGIDPLTYLDEITMSQVQKLREKGQPGEPPTLPDYGQLAYNLDKMMREAVGAPFHFIVVAHMKLIKDELSGKTINVPMASGDKFPQKVGGRFLEIWKFTNAHGKYTATTKSDSSTSLKALLNLFPEDVILTEGEGLPGETSSLWQVIKDRVIQESRRRSKAGAKRSG